MKYKISVVTGTRADYGLLKALLFRLKDNPGVILGLIVTGSHLSLSFGNTQNEIISGMNVDINEEYDVVIEAVGSNSAIDKSINIVKAGGNLVLMGNPEGDINLSQNTYWRILRKQLHVVGTWNSAYESNAACDWTSVVESLKNNELNVEFLITHKFDQDHLDEGLKLMLDHKEPYCKVMTVWNK